MAKQTGLGDNLYVGGTDCSGDINSITEAGGGPALLDFTAINVSAYERKGGVRDGRLSALAYYNPTNAHPELSALPTSDVHVAYFVGTALGNAAACIVSKQINYDGTREQDGSFKFQVDCLANSFGLEWATQVTAGVRTDASATNGTGVDFGTGSTTFGLQAYLQVFSIASGTATVKLQESSDNGAGDAFTDVTGGGFTNVTASTTERIATATNLTVERYLRVVTTGTFTDLLFAVAVRRNNAAPEF